MSAAAKACDNPEGKEALEKESRKVLKKMGYPSVEQAASHVTTLPKVLPCIVRRLGKLGECVSDLKSYLDSKWKKKEDEEDLACRTTDKILC